MTWTIHFFPRSVTAPVWGLDVALKWWTQTMAAEFRRLCACVVACFHEPISFIDFVYKVFIYFKLETNAICLGLCTAVSFLPCVIPLPVVHLRFIPTLDVSRVSTESVGYLRELNWRTAERTDRHNNLAANSVNSFYTFLANKAWKQSVTDTQEARDMSTHSTVCCQPKGKTLVQ
jgi:hypothetical protein